MKSRGANQCMGRIRIELDNEKLFMIGAAFVIFGCALFLWFGWRNRKKVNESMSWPNHSGRLIAASVRREVQQGGADSASATSYIPMVQYEYAVNNQVCQRNKVAFQDKGFNSKEGFRSS